MAYERIFKDKETGAREGDRTQQKKLFKKMKRGDEVVVESWERLTRSTRQLLNYDLMFRNLGVKLISLKQPVDLDTAFGRFVLEPRWQRRGPPAHRGRQGRRCRETLPCAGNAHPRHLRRHRHIEIDFVPHPP